MRSTVFKVWSLLALCAVLLGAFVVAGYPEPPARLLTPAEGWRVVGSKETRVGLSAIPEQFNQFRRSAKESAAAALFRNWTPAEGTVPLEVISPPFRPAPYMSVAVTGGNRTKQGRVRTVLVCESNGSTLDVFRGGVNVNGAEAIVAAPNDWCAGNARLKLIATESDVFVGAGAVFEISRLSYLKSGFLGRVPYLAIALAGFALVMLSGASMAIRFRWYDDPLPVALVSLGVAALGTLYFTSALPSPFRWAGSTFIALGAVVGLLVAGRGARAQAVARLAPHAEVWVVATVAYYSFLALAVNGLGHWEPNYRFWPASWSSDNELPWLFAEAVRHKWDIPNLFGGWRPTDRPPLMAGAHLLLSDAFGWLQAGNDGTYLRGQTYNASAVALNALWAPVCSSLLSKWRELDRLGRLAILLFLGCLPMTLFNTTYGWPKAFGAAFALMAWGVVSKAGKGLEDGLESRRGVLFFVLAALSTLAHASAAIFLMPLTLVYLIRSRLKGLRGLVAGFLLALAMMAVWRSYQSAVAPSSDPVTKFALTGDYGFADPGKPILQMMRERYESLTPTQWLRIKAIMLGQTFWPMDQPITRVGLNEDWGAGPIDKLRAWDLLLLSKGNALIPIFFVLAVGIAIQARLDRRPLDRDAAGFMSLIAVSSAAWLFIVIAFLAPIVIPTWPLPALFGLALGSASVVYTRWPRLLRGASLMMVTYTALVWGVSPLTIAVRVDYGAALALILLAVWQFARWRTSYTAELQRASP